ncbi:MAG: 2-isopropylmalate synthase [Thermostichus sp. BF3_bins_97]
MTMLSDPGVKYRPFAPIHLPDRTWPNRVITKPPLWMSTDLRDGNQALVEPMNGIRKLRMFELLVQIGFKQIEVAFPAASQTDFDFVRTLIEEDRIPEDVTIEVLTPAREDLIRRTLESLRGAKRAIVHLYNATAPEFRRVVFGLDRQGTIDLAVRGVRLIQELTAQQPETEWFLEYSPEAFTGTELDFAKAICDAVTDTWQPTPTRQLILNLPATVELATPNVYADQIEWMSRHLNHRECIVLSVHPHNDRGTGIAAAELALMAGAERVEGCLFGHGERTGNVDLVTLALNLYTQGIHPGLDLSQLDEIRRCVEECTQLPVGPRHPYAGDLVFTAFSGSHQDAIKKGFAAQDPQALWQVPYLPLDPADVGRSYDAVIRVNSQSGKGGVAFLLERAEGLKLPRRLQIEFSQRVQQVADATGKELAAADIAALFHQLYLEREEPFTYLGHHLHTQPEDPQLVQVQVQVRQAGELRRFQGQGNGPIDALVNGINARIPDSIQVIDYQEHAIGSGADSRAAAYIQLRWPDGSLRYGVGIDANIVTASFRAIFSGLNQAYGSEQAAGHKTRSLVLA